MSKGKTRTIGFAITGSFCTHEKVKKAIEMLVEQGDHVIPVFSSMTQKTDSRFGRAEEFIRDIQKRTGERGIFTIPEAEPIGPKKLFDILVIAPCTGNTLAKLCLGITDSPVLMAAKAHMRNERPVVIAISTNDALGASFKNIGELMNTKGIYFVPFGQDDWEKKPKSMVAYLEELPATIDAAFIGKQIQPVIRSPYTM